MTKADLIIDLQYGSTGKGLIAGYMGHHGNYDLVVNANMPNAGHTFIDEYGNKMVHKVLPSGITSPEVMKVGLGPGSVFCPDRLLHELRNLQILGYGQFDLYIHENAVVLTDSHRAAEQSSDRLSEIGSTQQGSAAGMIQKILRNPVRNPTAGEVLKNNSTFKHCLISSHDWVRMMLDAKEILIEGAQGYSLGISAGFYPWCTSRDCTPARFLADCGVPHKFLRRVIGTARIHPIRVGGTSGGCYPDQKEISWEDLGQPEERTTVTNKVRRVFTWSYLQMREALAACQPDSIFLNFCNYAPGEVDKVIGGIRAAGSEIGYIPDVAYTGWGPTVNDVRARIQDPCDMTRTEINRGNA